MAGINHLYDIYKKKGKKFIDNLFNSFVTVNEKMDGSSFNFERDLETGKFKFFKRNQNTPISLVDRTLSKYYEKPINYIESLPPHIIDKIPRGWRFSLEYFPDNNPVKIKYDRVPKNNLILSFVQKKDNLGKVTDIIQNREELDNWADLLGVQRPPIIFQGKLNDTQKSEIMSFLNTPFKELVEIYKTRSFVSFIIQTLDPDLDKTALNDDIDKAIEGIVFRFGEDGKDSDKVLAKMVDPVFTEIVKEKSNNYKRNKPSDFLGIALLDVMNFILESGITSFGVDGKNREQRYISFINDVFVKFCSRNEDNYKGMDFEEPDYLKRDDFKINLDMIDDERVEKYLEMDDAFESLYKLILNSFRKVKKSQSGVMTEDVLKEFNDLVSKISSYVQPKEKQINESKIPSFSNFRESIFSDNSDYVVYDDEESNVEEQSFDDFINALETIEENEPSKKPQKKSKEKVNLIVGRFQPLHLGHVKMIESLYKENELPVEIAVVHPGNNNSGNSPFPSQEVEKYISRFSEKNDKVSNYKVYKNGFLGNILSDLNSRGKEVICLGCGEERIPDYEKQVDYLKNGSSYDIIGDKFNLKRTPRKGSGSLVRKKIADGDFIGFKKSVPQEVANMYESLRQFMNPDKIKESNEYSDFIEETIEQIQDLKVFLGSDVTEDSEDIKNKISKKMEKIIKDFDLFNQKILANKITESDGFGTLPFLRKKEDEVYNYFFNLDGEKSRGFHLSVGKYSEYEPIDGPKNSFAVLSINEISPEVIEDISMDIGRIPEPNKEKIQLSDNESSRLFKLISKCILDYLELNPKIIRIYDEMQDNISIENYEQNLKSIMISYLGEDWSVQEGGNENLLILLR